MSDGTVEVRGVARRTWRNHTGNQAIQPLRILRPSTLREVVAIVQRAEAIGTTVRAVGSGHSWSDVALTGGFLVETHGLARPLAIVDARPASDTSRLVRVEAGIRIRELNAHLDGLGLALTNMGGYDGQTVAGVISTSTHGSGLGLGPLPAAVRSLDLVSAGGVVRRVEPADGITDPEAFTARRPDRVLVQDDHVFHAALVGMGCLGVIYAATLAVEPRYWLKEVRTLSTWEELAPQLAGLETVRAHRHFEVYVNPYPRNGRHRALVTTRDRTEPASTGLFGGRVARNLVPELLSSVPGITSRVIDTALDVAPGLAPAALDQALEAIADREFSGPSFRVLNIGAANYMPAYSSEIGVPLDGRHLEAMDRVFAVAARRAAAGDSYESSPIALRFVKASPAYLSMMHGRDTMMMELIQQTRTEGGFELLADYEEALYDVGGRPHWGQVNSLTGSHGLLAAMYPRLDDWLAVHAELNATGVFDSPFSKRVGIARSTFTP